MSQNMWMVAWNDRVEGPVENGTYRISQVVVYEA